MFDVLPGSQRSVRSPLLGLVAALVSHAAIVAIVLSSRTARGAEPRRVMVVDPGVLSLRRSSATPHAPGVPVVPGVPPDLPVIDPARRTLSGATVPGKMTNPRNGKIDNVSGIFGGWICSAPPIAGP